MEIAIKLCHEDIIPYQHALENKKQKIELLILRKKETITIYMNVDPPILLHGYIVSAQ